MVFRPRYGMVGLVSMPWFVAFELLAPFVEVFGVAFLAVALVLMASDALGLTNLQLVDQDVVWLLLGTSLLYAVVLTLAALLIEELSFRRYRGLRDLAIAVWAALEENLGYRQMNAWWRDGRVDRGLAGHPARLGRHAASRTRQDMRRWFERDHRAGAAAGASAWSCWSRRRASPASSASRSRRRRWTGCPTS